MRYNRGMAVAENLIIHRGRGWLREYMVHFRYKWCNYYVRMSKNVALYPHERF